MAFDPDSRLYVAVYGARHVKVLDSAGTVTAEIETPGRNPTNVAFDPAGSLGLVVTEAEQGCLWSYPDRTPGTALFRGPRYSP
jgi:DNA-binding beta-propeller fold protein YncE